MRNVHLVDNPVAAEFLTRLRDERTGLAEFRRLADQLGAQLATAAAALLPIVTGTVRTPLADADGITIADPVVAVVLRAGLGLLPGVLQVFPHAPVGMIGLARNEDTLVADQYYRKVPDLTDRDLLVLEPMLATGGSASDALAELTGARRRIVLSVVATATAIERIHRHDPEVLILTAGLDPSLDHNGWIVPGLGDFGDRLWGA